LSAAHQLGHAGRDGQKQGKPRIETPLVQTAAMGKGLLLGFLLSALAAWPQIAGSQGMPATVLSIGDGDTIRVRMNGKPITVRLACIDAPETAQRPYGQNASKFCSSACRSAAQ
jgi:endonuclease YncB( thermonuclease family)